MPCRAGASDNGAHSNTTIGAAPVKTQAAFQSLAEIGAKVATGIRTRYRSGVHFGDVGVAGGL